MLKKNVAEGIHCVQDGYVNWFIVEDEGRLTIVDAGLADSLRTLRKALVQLGRYPEDIKALVLTHGHFDHLGFAEQIRSHMSVPVYIHEDDVPLTRHPRQYGHARARAPYFLTQVRALPIVTSFLWRRAWWPEPIKEVRRFRDGELPVPGSPQVVPTPGHTLGHCALHFPDRGAVIAGDAVVTLDPYRGTYGPQIVSGAATVDEERALTSLNAIADTGAQTVLVGHGETWKHGAKKLAETALQNGPS